jgi:transposase-like protein
MPKACPDCNTTMKPADDMACSKARFVCPECAPAFVLANATSFTDVQDPLPTDLPTKNPDDIEA